MAKNGILRPHRGRYSTALSQNPILRKGEIFFEAPDNGIGSGRGRMKMGDGVTAYNDLPYYDQIIMNSDKTTSPSINPDDVTISITNGTLACKAGVANGVASLDENARIPYSQLPESAMEFKGGWNASTNSPELIQGTGTNGDFYVVTADGTWNNIEFVINDRILFDGTSNTWIKLQAGQNIPIATSEVLGVVKSDDTTIKVSSEGVISAQVSTSIAKDVTLPPTSNAVYNLINTSSYYYVGEDEPTETNKLWITASTGILKYHDGTEWKAVSGVWG